MKILLFAFLNNVPCYIAEKEVEFVFSVNRQMREKLERKFPLTPYKRKSRQVAEAELILKKVKRNVKAKLYQFTYAIELFEFVPVKEEIYACMCTDGEHIFYNPAQLKLASKTCGYSYLEYLLAHMVIHGMLGHFEEEEQFRNKKLVWVIMDAQVKTVLDKMGLSQENEEKEWWSDDRSLRRQEEETEIVLGYAAYYKALKSKKKRRMWRRSADDYFVDCHEYWRMDILQKPQNQSSQSADNGTNQESCGNKKKEQNTIAISAKKKWKKARDIIFGKDTSRMPVEQCMQEMVHYQSGVIAGIGSGNISESVQAAAGEGMSYKELLEHFLKEKECCKEQIDTIDVMMYSYGLELYGDVPLVEPNEVNEIKQLNSIVIAIDTSGSCDGKIASRFIRETIQLFQDIKDTLTFDSIYILQCDFEIQKEECLTSLEELEAVEDIQLYGFGGTSFVPVFERVEELQKTEDLQVDALIYLTDTFGDFPEKQPEYPVYLVIPKEELDYEGKPKNSDIPGWAEWVSIE